MIKFTITIIPAIVLAIILALCAQLTRVLHMLTAMFAWCLSVIVCWANSPLLEKTTTYVLSCGELSRFINIKQKEHHVERQEKHHAKTKKV
ncbi:MAG: hypothetical protein EBS98_11390 [Chitinophagia bacterium]|jgi:uncharacterized membrane protein|nr:hypothetical protein [Chitinophagia bacterium]